MLPLPRVHRLRWGLFTHAEALAAGWSANALSRAVARGQLIRWRRGVYGPVWPTGSLITPGRRRDIDLARTGVAAALTTGAVVSHLPAVALEGWPVWAPAPRACTTVDDERVRVPGLHVHRTALAGEIRPGPGYRQTTSTRTVLDVACEFGAEAGLVVADAALARGSTSLGHLRRAVEQGAGRAGIASARDVAGMADRRSESPLESRSRWQCALHGLPAPEPQVCLYATDGTFLGRVDLYWEDGVVGEVDGAEKMRNPDARRALLLRHTALMKAGLRVTRWGETSLNSFGPTAQWVREELAEARADHRPRRWTAVPT